jgi:DNA-binding SARP family transcriptional activator
LIFQPTIPNHARVIIIHPNYYKQHLILQQFISQPDTAYVRLEGNTLSEAAVIAQIEVHTGYIAAIGHLTYLVLDECDRVIATALDNVILTLLNDLHSTKICILSRYLPQIIYHPSVTAITQIIPIDKALGLHDYTTTVAADHIEVHAFGQGRVFVNGREITDWKGDIARNLFFYMVDNPIITREVIYQAFWANSSFQKATNVFHVTKGNIHDALGIELFEQYHQFYRHKKDVILSYDVEDFHNLCQNGEELRDEAQLLKARQLYKHTFLDGANMPWIQTRRAELELEYCEMLRILADFQHASGNYDAALGTNLRILATYRTDEKIAEDVLTLWLKRHQPCEAVKVYEMVKAALQQIGGYLPRDSLENLGNRARSLCP